MCATVRQKRADLRTINAAGGVSVAQAHCPTRETTNPEVIDIDVPRGGVDFGRMGDSLRRRHGGISESGSGTGDEQDKDDGEKTCHCGWLGRIVGVLILLSVVEGDAVVF